MDLETTNKNYKYIFEDVSFESRTRFGWINDCLLGDIQTFLDGVEKFIQNKGNFPVDVPRGGGNLSVPILISTALEFVSALYVGKTNYIVYFSKVINTELKEEWNQLKIENLTNTLREMFLSEGIEINKNATIASISKNRIEIDRYQIKKEGGKLNVYENYNATENVKNFITSFFPEHPEQFKKLPLLFWDGIRNGIIHTFSPKPFVYRQKCIRFQFFVEDRVNLYDVILLSNTIPVQTSGAVYTTDFSDKKIEGSYSKQSNNTILIQINVFELYEVLKKAIENYRNELKINEDLQNKFFKAWNSIETYSQSIDNDKGKSKEAEILLSMLNKSNNYCI